MYEQEQAENEQSNIIKTYLDFLLRRKNIIIFFMLLGVGLGLFQYLKKPKLYEATALLKYQRQSVNPTAMSPDDSRTRPEDVVDTVTQQILSRSSLEGIIKDQKLYPELRENMPMESVVNLMKRFNIRTQFLEKSDIFSVSFRGGDQDKVTKTTNALAAKFIEENLRFRQEKASMTSTYIRDELLMAKKSLDEKEIIMRDYKLKFYNEMPEQLTNNTTRLTALQEQYQNNQSSILELERTRLLVQEQIAQWIDTSRQLASAESLAQISTEDKSDLNSAQEIRLQLIKLKSRYTDRHPEIVRLKKLLKEIESSMPTTLNDDSEESDSATSSALSNMNLDPQIIDLRQQLTGIDLNIKRFQEERITLESQIKKYENWINSTPVREAEWTKLTRDYEQLNEHYQELVRQNLRAESAQSLENQLKGSQFKIVDMAHYPERPIEPNFKKIMVMMIAMCTAIGGALALAIELINSSYRDPVKLETTLGLPIVCAVPVLYTRKEKWIKRCKSFVINLSLLIMGSAVVGAAAYFYMQGMIVL